ncbi:YfgM family protein [Legionella fairfieldensis]|uniref:YfgM family protein n=1 Tax=Legionella fairfieldensis TaxID=45064 RepID=UPI00048B2F26|nr:tetratricopeptide repeat protein [Legionella fairfieldensis]
MSVYMTEEEQLEAIKKWWNKYSNLITILLSLVLLTVAGIKYWNWHTAKIKTQASASYEHLMVAFSHQNNEAVQSYAHRLINNYDGTIYSDVARLILARLFITSDNYNKAIKELEHVANNSRALSLKQVARIRMARLFAAEKSYDKALAQLTTVDDKAYMPIINELRGDIYTATGKYQQAVAAYKDAVAEVHTNGMVNLFLEMKSNELAALTQSPVDTKEQSV